MAKVNVVLTGHLIEGADPAVAVEKMVAMTRLDQVKVERLLSSGKPTLIKKEVAPEVAEKYQAALTKIGVAVKLQPCAVKPAASVAPPETPAAVQPAPPAASSTPPPAPKPAVSAAGNESAPAAPQSPSVSAPQAKYVPKVNLIGVAPPVEEGSDNNPYATPQANLDTGSGNAGGWLDQPRKVSAGKGLRWVQEALALFLQAPLKWMGILLMIGVPLTIVMILVQLISPRLGVLFQLVFSVVWPIMTAGLMFAADDLDNSGTLPMMSVFRGFRERTLHLCLVGVFYLVGMILIIIVLILVFGGAIAAVAMGGGDPATFMTPGKMILMMLVGLALMVPLIAMTWFAPCLVALTDQPAWIACWLSLKGSLKNFLAFLVYGLVFLGVGIGIGIVFAILGAVLGLILGGWGAALLGILGIVLYPAAISVGVLSVYTACRDIFSEGA